MAYQPEVVIAPYHGLVDELPRIIYVESPNAVDESLPVLPPPPWLINFRMQVGPPITATPNSRRYPAPPDQSPLTIFKPMINACTVPAPRWIHVDDAGLATVLIFTDGAALNNGQPNASAGYGIVLTPGPTRGLSFRLNVEDYPPTSNRAEMMAVINALLLRVWLGEGFARIAIATDSEYVVRGICEWVFAWKGRNWVTRQGQPVANRDLWERLIEAVEKWEKMGVQVLFYLVKRELNAKADKCAKKGAVRTPFIAILIAANFSQEVE
jgi:ribonuclease HI